MDSSPEREEMAVAEETYVQEPVVREPQSNQMEEEGFVAYVRSTEVKEQMGLSHEVTSSALMKLADELRVLTENDNQFTQQIDEIEQQAREIQNDPQSLQHADKVSAAFTNAATVVDNIQEDRFPDADAAVSDLQEKARELEENQQLLNQKEEVNTYFEQAAMAVEKMKEA
jgi:prefoldin subunit 5